MEQSYAEANAKVKTSISSILTKALCIIVILALFALSFMGVRYVMIVAVALAGKNGNMFFVTDSLILI